MKNAQEKERFIELRAEGRSYADIAAALKVSKPTLIAWGKELQRDIGNARTLRMDELFEKYAVAKAKRVEVFGTHLNAILAELSTRNLASIATSSLLTLALKYGEFMKDESEPLSLQGEDLPFDMSSIGTVKDEWSV
ncbi:MAG: helix-turn-helix domain-containing protein [Syntrophales bacterium]